MKRKFLPYPIYSIFLWFNYFPKFFKKRPNVHTVAGQSPKCLCSLNTASSNFLQCFSFMSVITSRDPVISPCHLWLGDIDILSSQWGSFERLRLFWKWHLLWLNNLIPPSLVRNWLDLELLLSQFWKWHLTPASLIWEDNSLRSQWDNFGNDVLRDPTTLPCHLWFGDGNILSSQWGNFGNNVLRDPVISPCLL